MQIFAENLSLYLCRKWGLMRVRIVDSRTFARGDSRAMGYGSVRFVLVRVRVPILTSIFIAIVKVPIEPQTTIHSSNLRHDSTNPDHHLNKLLHNPSPPRMMKKSIFNNTENLYSCSIPLITISNNHATRYRPRR